MRGKAEFKTMNNFLDNLTTKVEEEDFEEKGYDFEGKQIGELAERKLVSEGAGGLRAAINSLDDIAFAVLGKRSSEAPEKPSSIPTPKLKKPRIEQKGIGDAFRSIGKVLGVEPVVQAVDTVVSPVVNTAKQMENRFGATLVTAPIVAAGQDQTGEEAEKTLKKKLAKQAIKSVIVGAKL